MSHDEETWTLTEKGHQWLGGYRKGHSDGYEEGHREGWIHGYDDGYADAKRFYNQHTEPQPGEVPSTETAIHLLEDDEPPRAADEIGIEGYARTGWEYTLTWDEVEGMLRHGGLHGPLAEPLPESVTVWCSCENRTVPAEDSGPCCG